MVLLTVRDVWRYVAMAHGEPCAMISGDHLMPVWCVASLDSLESVWNQTQLLVRKNNHGILDHS